MRWIPRLASTALVTFSLAACSAPGVPSWTSTDSAAITHRTAPGIQISVIHPVKCPASRYACVDISAGGSGPYVKWSACSNGKCSPKLVPHSELVSRKTGLKAKWLSSMWSPNPGNPTEQRIKERRPIKPSKEWQFDDIVYACYANNPTSCSPIYTIGLIPR